MTNQDDQTNALRRRNNIAIGFILAGFVALVFAITVAKMMSGGCLQAADHVLRDCLLIEEGG